MIICSSIFSAPKRLEFAPHKSPDELLISSDEDSVKDDLLIRYQQIQNRVAALKVENEEVCFSDYCCYQSLSKVIKVFHDRSLLNTCTCIYQLRIFAEQVTRTYETIHQKISEYKPGTTRKKGI